MKKTFKVLIISLLAFKSFAQSTKVMDSPSGTVISNIGGTDIPYSASILDIRSNNKGILLPRMSTTNRDAIGSPQAGLLLYNHTTNQFNYHDGTDWQQATFGNQWNVNGTSYYYNGGNVGIGTSAPNYPFEVIGNARISSRLAINDPNPDYNLDVNGNAGIDNLGVGIAPDPAYLLKAAGIANLANLLVPGITTVNGITTLNSTTNVNGNLNANSNVDIDGTLVVNSNTTLDGALTVNGGKGVAYNTLGATNLKIYPFTTATFGAALGPHDSAVASIVFGGGFTSTPRVFVGDIDYTLGTSGELERVILILRGCSYNSGTGNTTCIAKIVNTDDASLNYDIRWNMLAVGY